MKEKMSKMDLQSGGAGGGGLVYVCEDMCVCVCDVWMVSVSAHVYSEKTRHGEVSTRILSPPLFGLHGNKCSGGVQTEYFRTHTHTGLR